MEGLLSTGPTRLVLKKSVCADGSQHFHETNRINSCYTKSLKNFFLITFFLWLFAVLSCLYKITIIDKTN